MKAKSLSHFVLGIWALVSMLASPLPASAQLAKGEALQAQFTNILLSEITPAVTSTSTPAPPPATPTRTPRPTATPVPTPPPANPGTTETLSVFGVLIALIIIIGIWLNRRKVL
jgi:hypothetical protein